MTLKAFAAAAKPRALTTHAIERLKEVAKKPLPSHELNAGVVDKLLKEGLVKVIKRPSPYDVDKGKPRDFLEVTPAGKDRLVAIAEEEKKRLTVEEDLKRQAANLRRGA